MACTLNIASRDAFIGSLGTWAWVGPELWVSFIVLGLILLAALAGMYVQRKRRLRVDAVFRQLIDDARFEPIESEQQRQELRQCVHELLTGERVSADSAIPLAHAVSYRSDDLTLNVLHVAQDQRTAGISEPDSLVVICDGFDTKLPDFRLLPSNILLRQTVGQGIYARDTRFGQYNLVFSKEPQRVVQVLDEEAQTLLDGNNMIAIECTAQRLMLYRHDNKAQPEVVMPFVEDCLTLAHIIRDNALTIDQPTV